MGYYLAPSLVALRAEIDKLFPGRDKTSDGWIGDTSHQARPSDHNPDYANGGVVRAIDVDVDDLDPSRDLRAMLLAAAIKDPRVYYVITNGKIYSQTYGFAERAYTGSNGHFAHVHISIRRTAEAENDTSTWFTQLPTISLANVRQQAENGGKRVNRGVRRVQRALRAEGYAVTIDGRFGGKTKRAYAAFEKDHGFDGDGLPGLPSLRKLGAGRFKVRK